MQRGAQNGRNREKRFRVATQNEPHGRFLLQRGGAIVANSPYLCGAGYIARYLQFNLQDMVRRFSLLLFIGIGLLLPFRAICQEGPAVPIIEQYAPTPKAMEHIRSGILPVDLNSGTVSLEIPVGSYEDADFTIPISLRYSTGGLRPLSPSGDAGLGWSLSAGGSITREIVGVDDFVTGGYYNTDNHYSADSVYFLTRSIHWNEDYLPSVDPGYHETTSDIYHFSFPGHSGSFVIANDGTFTAYDTSGERGTSRLFTIIRMIKSFQARTKILFQGIKIRPTLYT